MTKEKLKMMQYDTYLFFQENTNFDKDSKGFGLTIDHTNNQEVASIAATGFTLSSFVIGIENKYMSYEEGYDKSLNTLKSIYNNASHMYGFFAHFLNIKTAERHQKCEYSTIDTALFLNGVITVSSYFKDELINKYAHLILDRVDWNKLIHYKDNKPMFYMSYNPDKDGDYVKNKPGFIHQWDMFAEQMMMYVIYAANNDSDLAYELYLSFKREIGVYKNIEYIFSPGNALFVYLFPLAWLNLENVIDYEGISWHNNAKNALLAHYHLSADLKDKYQTFKHGGFGFTASDTKDGYKVFGGLPNRANHVRTDGTVAPFSVIGALPFIPNIAKPVIDKMLKIPNLYGKYGFMDAYNLEDGLWISNKYIAIDKGLEMLMLNAYLSQDVYHAYMSHPIIQKGMSTLKWKSLEIRRTPHGNN
jgi:hypothetical protein